MFPGQSAFSVCPLEVSGNDGPTWTNLSMKYEIYLYYHIYIFSVLHTYKHMHTIMIYIYNYDMSFWMMFPKNCANNLNMMSSHLSSQYQRGWCQVSRAPAVLPAHEAGYTMYLQDTAGGWSLAWHRFSSFEMHFYLLEVELESLTTRNDSPGLDGSFFSWGGGTCSPRCQFQGRTTCEWCICFYIMNESCSYIYI